MFRTSALLGFGFLTLTLFLTAGWVEAFQKDGEKKEVQKDQPKGKVALPANWKKLGLTEEQTKKILEVRGDFAGKLANLNSQIKSLKSDENTELMKLLTDDQKILLKKILTEKIPDTKKEEKKDPGKDKGQSRLRQEPRFLFAWDRSLTPIVEARREDV